MSQRLLLALLFVGLLVAPLSAQEQKPPPPQKPPSQPAPTPTPTPAPDPGSRSTRDVSPAQDYYQYPLYISGKVVLEDGTPVPYGVKVELLSSGQVKRQEFTRSDGSFTFDLSSPSHGMVSDASFSGADDVFSSPTSGGAGGMQSGRSMGRMEMSGWEVRAVLAGYASETIMLANRSALDNPDVGTIVLRPLGPVKATTISMNALKAPKKAKKSLESAEKALKKNRPDHEKALKELHKAIEAYPEYSAAWQLLGEVRMEKKDGPGARQAFEKALSTDDKYINPYLSLAALEIQENRWEEASKVTARLLELNPYVMHGHFLNAVACFNSGKLDAAADSARHIQKSEEAKRYPLSHYILGAVLAGKGDVPSAAREFRAYLKEQPGSSYSPRIQRVLTEWEQKGLLTGPGGQSHGATGQAPAPPK